MGSGAGGVKLWVQNRLCQGLSGHMVDPRIDLLIDARRNHRHSQRFIESGLYDRAHDDVCFLVDFLANPAHGLVDIIQRQILTAGDRNQKTPSSFQRGVVE